VALGLVNPLGALLSVVADPSWLKALRKRHSDLAIRADGCVHVFDLFWDLVDKVSSARKTVVVIDPSDMGAVPDLIRIVAAGARRHRFDERPLLVLFGVPGPARAVRSEALHAEVLPPERSIDITFPPLDERRIARWLGRGDRDFVRLLIDASGGDDKAAAEVVRRWRDRRFATRARGKWSFERGSERGVGKEYERALLAIDEVRADLAREALQIAALFGGRFSPGVVAAAVARNQAVDASGVVEALDELLVPVSGLAPLVRSVDHWVARIGEADQTLWRYEWTAPTFRWQALLDSAADEASNRAAAGRLFDALIVLPGAPDRFLAELAELARRAGDDDRMVRAARLHWHRTSVLDWLILLESSEWLTPSVALVEKLAWAGRSAADGRWLTLGARLARRALITLSHLSDCGPATSGPVLLLAGQALQLGGFYDEAADALHAAQEVQGRMYEATPTPANRRILAVTLHALGVLRRDQGRLVEADEYLTESLGHSRALYEEDATPANRRILAVTLYELGVVRRDQGRLVEADEYLTESLGHDRALYDEDATPVNRRSLAFTLRELGVVRRDQGRLVEADEYLTESLGHSRALYDEDATPANRRSLAFTLYELGVVRRDQGRVEEAERLEEEARRLGKDDGGH